MKKKECISEDESVQQFIDSGSGLSIGGLSSLVNLDRQQRATLFKCQDEGEIMLQHKMISILQYGALKEAISNKEESLAVLAKDKGFISQEQYLKVRQMQEKIQKALRSAVG